MISPIRTGVLAFGMSGRLFHVPFIAGNDKFILSGVVERTKKKVHQTYPGTKSFDSVEDLITDKEIELVVVNTPNYLHYEHVRLALENGKDVLVEKPFVPTSKEAEELFELAEAKKRSIFVYQNRRFDSDFKTIRTIVEEGKLGKLSEMHIRFDRYRSYIGPKAFKEDPFPASGITYDLGSHLIDQCIALFGAPLKSLKINSKNRVNTKVDDYAHFILFYPEDFMVYVTATYLAADPGPAYVIHGRNGSFKKSLSDVQEKQLDQGISPFSSDYGKESEGREGRLTLLQGEAVKTHAIPGQSGNYNELFEALYASMRDHQPFPIKSEEILEQLRILEQNAISAG